MKDVLYEESNMQNLTSDYVTADRSSAGCQVSSNADRHMRAAENALPVEDTVLPQKQVLS